MKINIINNSGLKFDPAYTQQTVDFFKEALEKQKINISATEFSIALIDEETMKNLNKKFRNKDGITDILSFSDTEPECLGEIVICMPQVIRQAKEHKLTLNQEVAYLILHGMLHLLGYDHEKNPEEAEVMYKIQDGIFQTWLDTKGL